MVDLSSEPPCSINPWRYIKHATKYEARILGKAYNPMMNIDDQRNLGWNQDVEIDCNFEAYPDDLA